MTRPAPTGLDLTFSAAWFLTGSLWFLQAFVPWTANGSLSRSSTLDAAALIRSGSVTSIAPTSAGWLLPALPVVGLLVAASAFSQHRITWLLRATAVLLTVGATLALTSSVTGFAASALGPGALLAWSGCALSLILCTIWGVKVGTAPRGSTTS